MKVNTEELNKAIEIFKEFCSEHHSCQDCPFSENCGDTPENWKLLNREVD